jgi:stage V sporulation protein D (sporulation-specific penicillin-binding protein)
MLLSNKDSFSKERYKAIITIFIVLLVIVMLRLLFLISFDRSFLLNKAMQQADHPRVIPASRGIIFDRNGVPLAISAPIKLGHCLHLILIHAISLPKKIFLLVLQIILMRWIFLAFQYNAISKAFTQRGLHSLNLLALRM